MRKNIIIVLLSAGLIFTLYSYYQQNYDWVEAHIIMDMQVEALVRQARAIEALRNPQHFESVEALSEWVRNWTFTKLPIIVGESNSPWQVTFRTGNLSSEYWGCDDIAEAMQRDALKDGFILSKALVDYDGNVYGVHVSELENHAGNLASTENAYWFIEPQTGTITKIIGRK